VFIASFDPGRTTGCVLARWESGRDFYIIETYAIPWDERFVVVKDVLSFKPEHIVVESFRLYPHSARAQIGQDFPSSQVIGIIETYAYENSLLSRITKQPAAVRSNVKVTHEEIKGSSVHIVDAYLHLRYFIIVNLPKLERSKF
jgi:hypothetical protein